MKMKYSIYRGTEDDMRNAGGTLFSSNLSKKDVIMFCKQRKINYDSFLDGELLYGFWLEEA